MQRRHSMCWLCENPGATRADYLAHLRDLIVRHGWIVQGVERDGPHPPWSYTAGLTEAGLPELVITGMRNAPAARLLNRVAAHIVHAEPPLHGDRIALEDGPVIEIVEVSV